MLFYLGVVFALIAFVLILYGLWVGISSTFIKKNWGKRSGYTMIIVATLGLICIKLSDYLMRY